MSEISPNFLYFSARDVDSFVAAALIAGCAGLVINNSASSIGEAQKRGFAVEQGDALHYQQRNVATGVFAINLVQELAGAGEFAQALINLTRAARDYVVVQHPYFDEDSELALRGLQIATNFDKRVKFRPNIADYLNFVAVHREGLRISGVAIYTSSKVTATALDLAPAPSSNPPKPIVMPKTLRVVIGRKNRERFRRILDKAQLGDEVFLWEQS
jgi:hypothetical protein